VFHDYAVLNLESEAEILKELDKLYNWIKEVDGPFNAIFSNELLGGDQPVDWIELYSKVIQRYHV
jgi:hypothetical protein